MSNQEGQNKFAALSQWLEEEAHELKWREALLETRQKAQIAWRLIGMHGTNIPLALSTLGSINRIADPVLEVRAVDPAAQTFELAHWYDVYLSFLSDIDGAPADEIEGVKSALIDYCETQGFNVEEFERLGYEDYEELMATCDPDRE